jgi:hypothetical protein
MRSPIAALKAKTQSRFTSTFYTRTQTYEVPGRRDRYRERFDPQQRAQHAQAAMQPPLAAATQPLLNATAQSGTVRGIGALRAATAVTGPSPAAGWMPEQSDDFSAVQSLALAIAQAVQMDPDRRGPAAHALREPMGRWLTCIWQDATACAGVFSSFQDPVLRQRLAAHFEWLLRTELTVVSQRLQGVAPPADLVDGIPAAAQQLADHLAEQMAQSWQNESGTAPWENAISHAVDTLYRGAYHQYAAAWGAPPIACPDQRLQALHAVIHGRLDRADAARQHGVTPERMNQTLQALAAAVAAARETRLMVTDQQFQAIGLMIAGDGLSDWEIGARTGLATQAVADLRTHVLAPLAHRLEVDLVREDALVACMNERAARAPGGKTSKGMESAFRTALLDGPGAYQPSRNAPSPRQLAYLAETVRCQVFANRPGLMRGEEDRPQRLFDASNPQRDLLACGVIAIGLQESELDAMEQAVRDLQPHQGVAAAWRTGGWVPPATPQQDRAWQLLHAMAVHPSSMQTVLALVGTDEPALCNGLRLFLRASRHLAQEQGRAYFLPSQAIAAARARPSLVGKALLAAAAQLAGEDPAGIPDRWAMNAFRNGFTTDEAGSPFAFHEARLERLSRWLDVATQPAEKWNPLRRSSPLAALRQGYAGADQSPVDEKVARYDDTLRNAIDEAQAVFARVLDQIQGPPWTPQQWAELNARLLVLTQWRKQVNDNHPDGCPIDPMELARLSYGRDAWTQQALQTLHGTVMTEDLLREWVRQTRHTSAATGVQVDWAPVQRQLAQARMIVEGRHETVRTRDEIQRALQEIIGELRLASRLRLMSGHTYGLSTKALSATISKLFLGASGIRVRADLRGEVGRHAVLELAHPSHAFEVFVGVQNNRAAHVGGGAGLAWNLGAFLTNWMGDAVLLGHEYRNATGLVLRLPRQEHTEDENREEFIKLVTELLCDDPEGPGGCDSPQPLLKRLLEAHPSLSVTVVGKNSEQRWRSNVSTEGTARLGVGHWRVGGASSATYEVTPRLSGQLDEQTGTVQIDSFIEGRATKAMVDARGMGTTTAQASDQVRLSLGSVEGKQAIEASMTGRRQRARLAYLDGRLQIGSCTRDIEYENVGPFAKSVRDNVEQWLCVAMKKAGLDCLDTPEQRAQAERMVLEFVDAAEREDNGNQYFAERMRLKAEVGGQIDAHRAVIELARHSADPEVQRRAAWSRAAVDELLDAADSWEPRSLRVYERGLSQAGPQFNYFALASSVLTSEGLHVERELR